MKKQSCLMVVCILLTGCADSGSASSEDGGESSTEQSTAADADADGDGDADSDGDSDSDGDTDTDGDGDGDTDGDGDSDGDTDADGDADADGDSDGDADTDGDADGDADTDTDTDGDSDSDGDADGDADADTDGDGDTDEETESTGDTNQDTDSGTVSDTDVDTNTDTGWDSDLRPASECESDEDCQLVDDCCNCLAIPTEAEAPECTFEECIATKCEVHRVEKLAAVCKAGRCTYSLSCDASRVSCEMGTPECSEEGTVPAVDGTCWTGSCVRNEQCSDVTDCAHCLSGQQCVVNEGLSREVYHCVSVPEECKDRVDCSCMVENVCTGIYPLCSDREDKIYCAAI